MGRFNSGPGGLGLLLKIVERTDLAGEAGNRRRDVAQAGVGGGVTSDLDGEFFVARRHFAEIERKGVRGAVLKDYRAARFA